MKYFLFLVFIYHAKVIAKTILIREARAENYKAGEAWLGKNMTLEYECGVNNQGTIVDIPANALNNEGTFVIQQTIECLDAHVTIRLVVDGVSKQTQFPLPNCLTDAHVAMAVSGATRPTGIQSCMEEVFQILLPPEETYTPCCFGSNGIVVISMDIQDDGISRVINATEISLTHVEGFELLSGDSLVGKLVATDAIGESLGFAAPLNIKTKKESITTSGNCGVSQGTTASSFSCEVPLKIVVESSESYKFVYTIAGKSQTIAKSSLVVEKKDFQLVQALKPECFATEQRFYPYPVCTFDGGVETISDLFSKVADGSDDLMEKLKDPDLLYYLIAAGVGGFLGCMVICLCGFFCTRGCCNSDGGGGGDSSKSDAWQA